MKKFIVVIYSFLILFQSFNINIEDFSKLNALWEHASYHQQVYGENFFVFLSEHYGEKMTSHQDDHKDHKNLPFKDSNHMHSHVNMAFVLFEPVVFSVNSQPSTAKSLDFFYKKPFSSFKISAVFQPPQIA